MHRNPRYEGLPVQPDASRRGACMLRVSPCDDTYCAIVQMYERQSVGLMSSGMSLRFRHCPADERKPLQPFPFTQGMPLSLVTASPQTVGLMSSGMSLRFRHCLTDERKP